MENQMKLTVGDRVRLIKLATKISCPMPEGSEGTIVSLDVYNIHETKLNRRAWNGQGWAMVTIQFDDTDPRESSRPWSVPSTFVQRIPSDGTPQASQPPYDPDGRFTR